MMKLLALTLIPVALVGGVVANSSVLLVDVNDGDTHIFVPVPLSLAQVALAFAPDAVKRIQVPELAEYIPHLERVIQELRDAPDAVFVTVEDGNDFVTVTKVGDLLKVSVIGGRNEKVDVSIPMAALTAMLNAYDAEEGYFRTSKLVGALRAAPSGQLVHVLDGNEEVSVRMW